MFAFFPTGFCFGNASLGPHASVTAADSFLVSSTQWPEAFARPFCTSQSFAELVTTGIVDSGTSVQLCYFAPEAFARRPMMSLPFLSRLNLLRRGDSFLPFFTYWFLFL